MRQLKDLGLIIAYELHGFRNIGKKDHCTVRKYNTNYL